MAIYFEKGDELIPAAEVSAAEGSDADIDEGGNEQDVAEPADVDDAEDGEEGIDEGGREQEVAEPVDDTDNDIENANGAGKPQSADDNRKFAAERRRAEIEQAKAEARNEAVKVLGIIDPTTGQAFDSFDKLLQARKSEDQSKLRSQLERAGIDPSLVDKLIDENPVVKEAQRITAEADAAKAKAEQQTNNANFEKLLSEVGSVVPEIKEARDLISQPWFNDFRKLINAGFDAKKACQMAAMQTNEQAVRQSVYNSVAGKSHLRSTKTATSSGDFGITDEQYANILAAVPGISRKDAAAKQKKYGI